VGQVDGKVGKLRKRGGEERGQRRIKSKLRREKKEKKGKSEQRKKAALS